VLRGQQGPALVTSCTAAHPTLLHWLALHGSAILHIPAHLHTHLVTLNECSPPLPVGALLLASLLLLPEYPCWLVLTGQLDLAAATLHTRAALVTLLQFDFHTNLHLLSAAVHTHTPLTPPCTDCTAALPQARCCWPPCCCCPSPRAGLCSEGS
jgi:hypothetical protein